MKIEDFFNLRIEKVRKSDFRVQSVHVNGNASATLSNGNKLAMYDVRASITYQDKLVDEINATMRNGMYGNKIPDNLWGETNQEIILRRVNKSLNKMLKQQNLPTFEIFKEQLRQCYLNKTFQSVYGLDYPSHICPDTMLESFENLYCLVYPEYCYHRIIFGKDKYETIEKMCNLLRMQEATLSLQ